jgi:competence ComEA-like helix-hairpin-helix protein
MNRYLAATVLPLVLLSSLSYASVKSEAHIHRKAALQHEVSVEKVNINTANAQQLATLKGVGPKKADAIIAYRNEHGPFADVNALSSVKGMGSKKILAIQKQGLAYTASADKAAS